MINNQMAPSQNAVIAFVSSKASPTGITLNR
ncbi:hypothetical protein B840_12005 [Corynebacterium marinum DSM 44953]|uniref:Uncharacterized protein n=1 Tax=Corynebacterium marinum DSM 44953 TaxID=1224162 RepID=A0A0B6TUM3_9CORY|nr:hypothetical protein B840_12005 [Corynebacterium marinum DSM 44953]